MNDKNEWVLVPRELTPEMAAAGNSCVFPSSAWAAMLAAAPKPEAQAAGVDALPAKWRSIAAVARGAGMLDCAATRQACSYDLEAALSTPASHDAQHEAVTEHEGEFGLPPLPASAVYWRQRAEFWREQAVSLGWREKRDAENGEAQQPAVVEDWTDEKIITVCKAAGIKWIERDAEEYGFPGGFDIAHMPEMRRLFIALTPAAAPGGGGAQDELSPAAPMPTDKEKWMALYVIRMAERGIHPDDAWACCRAGESDHDYNADPREAADEEMSYWTDDGDGPTYKEGNGNG